MGTKEIVKGSTLGFVDQSSDQSYEAMRDKLLDRIKTTFSPEFLNRIDETIVFHSLSEEHVLDIINLQLEDLRTNLQRKGIKIRLTKSALKLLVKKGFNPEYGARHLRREIQNSLEDPISEMLLEEKYVERDTIKVNAKKNVFLYSKAPIKKDKSKKSTPSIDSTEEVKSP